MAKVSIIVPAYNREKYIGQCLDSLLNQTYKDLEIIVVDDASTDDTPQIVEEYRKRHPDKIKLKKLERNSGPSVARNEGIKIAEGEYICFCDSDDWFHKERIEKMVRFFEKNPSKVLVSTNALIYDETQSKVTGLLYIQPPLKDISDNAFIACLEYLCTKGGLLLAVPMVRREVFIKELFDPMLRRAQDADFVFRVAYRFPEGCALIDEPLYFIRRHPSQIGKRFAKRGVYHLLQLPFYRKFVKLWHRHLPLPSKDKERYLWARRHILRYYANFLLREGYYKDAISFYKEILLEEPLLLRFIYKFFILCPYFGRFTIKVYHNLKKLV